MRSFSIPPMASCETTCITRIGRSGFIGSMFRADPVEVGDHRTMRGTDRRFHPAAAAAPAGTGQDLIDPNARAAGEVRVAQSPTRPGERIVQAVPGPVVDDAVHRRVEVARDDHGTALAIDDLAADQSLAQTQIAVPLQLHAVSPVPVHQLLESLPR